MKKITSAVRNVQLNSPEIVNWHDRGELCQENYSPTPIGDRSFFFYFSSWENAECGGAKPTLIPFTRQTDRRCPEGSEEKNPNKVTENGNKADFSSSPSASAIRFAQIDAHLSVSQIKSAAAPTPN